MWIVISAVVMALTIVVAGILFTGKGQTVEFKVLSEQDYPQEICSDVIPEYRSLERALACVVEDKVYVIAREYEIPYLYIARKAELQFVKQDLSFVPIAIYVDDNELYLAQQGDYQIVKINDGEEEKLPVFATYYQVIDGKIIYLDATTYFDSCFDLVSYDMKSGQSEVICENVFDFAVLDADYIYIQCDTIPNSEFYLYDYKELLNIKK